MIIDYDALAWRIEERLMSGRDLVSQGELKQSLLLVIGSDNYRRFSWTLYELSFYIAQYLRESLPTIEETCDWVQQDMIFGVDWVTDCGKEFCVDERWPSLNGMKFCCFCGKKLIDVPFDELEDEES